MDYLNKLLKTLILLALMLPTFAQESEDEEEGLEVVVTTATKTENSGAVGWREMTCLKCKFSRRCCHY